MFNKILYFPTEGTTGFWFNGVEIVNPEVFSYPEKDKIVLFSEFSERILKPGDIFDLPIGYEFKGEERFIPKPYKKLFSQTPVEAKIESVKVLRLVKTEMKEQPEFNDGRWVLSRHPSLEAYKENYQKALESCKYLSPEPEESLTSEIKSFVNSELCSFDDEYGRYFSEDSVIKMIETFIQRKKQ